MSGLHSSGINPVTNGSLEYFATGTFTGDGSGTVGVNIGFTPQFVLLIDMTLAKRYEWVNGMAATDSELLNGTGPAFSVDANSAIVTNGALNTVVSAGVYPPGTQEPGGGTIQNSGNISVWAPDKTKAQLTFGINVTSSLYTWIAMG